eukprot:TRINITY_DN853_c0_g1_i1.p1 TRINITY_DN853_c0_g1~~TRINITY_DN853_c0_g1_i1.p1  ORF type:complete len:521 (+),score=129.10 TRINITY_DN853_c0_g1_i1:51-1613(+)
METHPKHFTDCMFFSKAQCAKSEDCGFRHWDLETAVSTPCRAWQSPAGCSNQQCRFRHIAPNSKPCYYFAHGGCTRGLECPFVHSGASDSSIAPSPGHDIRDRSDSVVKRKRDVTETSTVGTTASDSTAVPNCAIKSLEQRRAAKRQQGSATVTGVPSVTAASAAGSTSDTAMTANPMRAMINMRKKAKSTTSAEATEAPGTRVEQEAPAVVFSAAELKKRKREDLLEKYKRQAQDTVAPASDAEANRKAAAAVLAKYSRSAMVAAAVSSAADTAAVASAPRVNMRKKSKSVNADVMFASDTTPKQAAEQKKRKAEDLPIKHKNKSATTTSSGDKSTPTPGCDAAAAAKKDTRQQQRQQSEVPVESAVEAKRRRALELQQKYQRDALARGQDIPPAPTPSHAAPVTVPVMEIKTTPVPQASFAPKPAATPAPMIATPVKPAAASATVNASTVTLVSKPSSGPTVTKAASSAKPATAVKPTSSTYVAPAVASVKPAAAAVVAAVFDDDLERELQAFENEFL